MKPGDDAIDARQLSLADYLDNDCQWRHAQALLIARKGQEQVADALAQDYLKVVETRNEWADALTKSVRLSGDH